MKSLRFFLRAILAICAMSTTLLVAQDTPGAVPASPPAFHGMKPGDSKVSSLPFRTLCGLPSSPP
jgi:hypothetical protein